MNAVMITQGQAANFNWSFEQDWLDDQSEHEFLLVEDRLAGRRPSRDAKLIPSVQGWMEAQGIPAPVVEYHDSCSCGVCQDAEYEYYMEDLGPYDGSYVGKAEVQKDLWLQGASVAVVADPYDMGVI